VALAFHACHSRSAGGFPQPTYDRCARFANFHLHEGSPVEAARELGDKVELQTPRGVVVSDFVICGTGTEIDFWPTSRAAKLCRQYRDLD